MSQYTATLHTPCQIHHTARLGDETVIWPFSTILEGAQLGKRCVVGTGVFIGRRCQIGDDVRFHPGAALPNDAVIGDRVYVGPNVVLVNDAYPFVSTPAGSYPLVAHRPPIVEDDAILGANAVLLPGVRIGAGAIVGAGAVVTHDVPPGVTVVGNPARRLWKPVPLAINEAGEVLHVSY